MSTQMEPSELNERSLLVKLMDQPAFLQFLDLKSLQNLIFLCKTSQKICLHEIKPSFFAALSHSFADYYGLYTLELESILKNDPVKYFNDEINIAKYKFKTQLPIPDSADETITNSFKINIHARFRPGVQQHQGVQLPLHQFLKVKRNKINNDDFLVGTADPEEFIDPLLGCLMKQPVLLITSGKIVDRSVAVAALQRRKDPFNNKKLNAEHIIPQDELGVKINDWRKNKCQVDVKVAEEDAKALVRENAVNQQFLSLLMDAEKITKLSKKLVTKTRRKITSDGDNEEYEEYEEYEEITEVDEAVVNNENTNNNSSIATVAIKKTESKFDQFQKDARQKEVARIVDVDTTNGSVSMSTSSGIKTFNFNKTHDSDTTQSELYGSLRKEIAACVNGFNVAIVVYGQTGSGKTFSSIGPDITITRESLPNAGICIRALMELLEAKTQLISRGVNMSISMQFIEIYNECCTDLLTGKVVQVRRSSGEISAVYHQLNTFDDIIEFINVGNKRKHFAATDMNEKSSRSHTAIIVTVNQNYINEDRLVKSTLHLVDLAGSERVKKSNVSGLRLQEAIGINNSLLVLGKCITSLVENKSHVPYYESTLTTMLKHSFGGNCRTSLIIACRKDDNHGNETLQSLRFGEVCSTISNNIKIAATSLESTITSIDGSLQVISSQLTKLEKSGKSGLDTYKTLQQSYEQLKRKRYELCQ